MHMAKALMVSPAFGFPLSPQPHPPPRCLRPSFETKTRPPRTALEEQGDTRNSIGFLGENNVGGTQASTGTSASALQ